MKAKTGVDAAIERARHLLVLYDLLCDKRERGVRSPWATRFKKFMSWPQKERLVLVEGSGTLLILRESTGISRQHFGHDYLSEILRFSIVAGVSALDRYLHDLVVEKSWKLLTRKEEDVPKELATLGLSALSTRKALNRLKKNPKARPGHIVKQAVQTAVHAQFTFQGTNQVTKAAKLLGIDDFWAQVAAAMPGTPSAGEAQATLTEIVKRRNQIVHEADLVLKTKSGKVSLRDVSRETAGEWINWIETFATAIGGVVDAEI